MQHIICDCDGKTRLDSTKPKQHIKIHKILLGK